MPLSRTHYDAVMHEMEQFSQLRDEPLTSRDGRHVLDYDDSGIATLTDGGTGEIRWRTGESGALLLGHDGVLQVEDEAYELVWAAELRHPDARKVVITDDGDLELLNDVDVPLVNSRTGVVEVTVLPGSAPAGAITDRAHLVVRKGRYEYERRVSRDRDGSLQVNEETSFGALGHTLSPRLALWFEQDGAELTWRQVAEKRGKSWRLVLVDAGGNLLWRDTNRGAPTQLPASTPYAHGGHELPAGGRLWHQSLTSPNGSHTLVHQEDGNLVLYCNSAQQAVWATNTWWAGNGWADLSDGDLVVRTMYGAPLWRAATTGAARLLVNDDGTMALEGTPWVFDGHAGCTQPGMNTARGNTLTRGQVLQRQSLTAPDAITVFAHRDDGRLVQFDANGTWVWDEHVGDGEGNHLTLDEDGMLRVHNANGVLAKEIAGPADALVVTSEGLELRSDGKCFWRNGKRVVPQSWDDWMSALVEDTTYCATLIHDIEPADALRRLLGDDAKIHDGTWHDLQTLADDLDTDWEDTVVAAFRIGDHTLLVEDNGWLGNDRPDLSAGTFAVTCCRNINAHSSFRVFRDGAVVADHSWDDGSAEPTTAEVRTALAAMGSDDPVDTAFEADLELFCRTAGVYVTVADVTGPCLYAAEAEE